MDNWEINPPKGFNNIIKSAASKVNTDVLDAKGNETYKDTKLPEKIVLDIRAPEANQMVKMQKEKYTTDRMQEAIIWSEILGKPLCKRRKRRQSWQ